MASGSRFPHLPGCLAMTSGPRAPERTPKIPQTAKGGAVAPAALGPGVPFASLLLRTRLASASVVAGASKSRRAARGIGTGGGQIGSAARANPCAVLVPSCGCRLSAGVAQVDRRTRVAQVRAGQAGI